jgi:hypothetical protein
VKSTNMKRLAAVERRASIVPDRETAMLRGMTDRELLELELRCIEAETDESFDPFPMKETRAQAIERVHRELARLDEPKPERADVLTIPVPDVFVLEVPA